MNYELKMHNIRIAWRNLMKYKVQNTISVLCLAVGMVCFSMTFIFTYRQWQDATQKAGDSRRVKVQFLQKNSILIVRPDLLQRIANSHLSSIDFIDINVSATNTVTSFFNPDVKRYHHVKTDWRWIGPEHLHYLGLRSAITGKRIPVLKTGDMIMTKGMWARTFGQEVNPVGFTIDWSSPYSHPCSDSTRNVVIDVVDMGDWMFSEDHMFVVTDLLKESTHSWEGPCGMIELDIILAKGKTDANLKRELQKILPKYEVRIFKQESSRSVRSIGSLLLLGGSVLLIGLFGFLKMQIQLFRLRQREIGLRQCMGARWGQLFGMLIWEVAIIFFFVTPLTLLLTYLLADGFGPVLHYMNPDGFVAIDMPRICATELWLCLGVFVVTSLIAALSVRKVVTKPLSEVVGRSQRKLTRSYSLLIVLQMVVCLFLVDIPMSVIYVYQKTSPSEKHARAEKVMREFNFEEDFKEGWDDCMITNNEQWSPKFLDTLQHLQHLEGVTHFASICYSRNLKEGEEADNVKWDENGQRHQERQVVLTDKHFFDLLDLKLIPSATDKQCESEGLVPVYQGMPNGDKLKKLGYVWCKPLMRFTWDYAPLPEAIYVCDTAFFLQHRDLRYHAWEYLGDAFKNRILKHNIIFKAKPDEYEDAVKELADLYHNLGIYTMVDAPIDNLAVKCYHKAYMVVLVLYILVVIFIVSLLCMVLTLYSSVSLDTRGRLREVAIRKANGAGMSQIMWLFGKQYVIHMAISGIISSFIVLVFYVAMANLYNANFCTFVVPHLYAILFVALVTLLTVGFKIYKVSKINPAKIMNRE